MAGFIARRFHEVQEINRAMLDVASTPPGTIEWEWDTCRDLRLCRSSCTRTASQRVLATCPRYCP